MHRKPPSPERAQVAPRNKRGKEHCHVGCRHAGPRLWPLRLGHRLRLRLRAALRRGAMIFDYSLAGLVSLGLLFYLTYALLRPERF